MRSSPGEERFRNDARSFFKDHTKVKALVTKKNAKNRKEGEILIEIEVISITPNMWENDKNNTIKIVEQVQHKHIKYVADIQSTSGFNFKSLSPLTNSEATNLETFFKHTSFVLQFGSIQDVHKAADFWNSALEERRGIYTRKAILLSHLVETCDQQADRVNATGADISTIADARREMKGVERGINKLKTDDAVKFYKKRLQETFAGQAKLKKAIVLAKRQKEKAIRKRKGEGHK